MARPHDRCVIPFAGTFTFPVTPAQMWSTIEAFDSYTDWWGWLGELTTTGERLDAGLQLSGTVSPPLPYRMRVHVAVRDAVAPTWLDCWVTGDLMGPATLSLSEVAGGTEAVIAWRMEMMQKPMRAAARVAYPLLRWAHDRVVEVSVAAFRRHLAGLPDDA